MQKAISTKVLPQSRPDLDALMEAYRAHLQGKNPKKLARLGALETAKNLPIDPTIQARVDALFEATRGQREQRLTAHAERHLGAEFALLGVQPGATQTQIKRAYRQKARALHPDTGGDEAAMKRLNDAYQKLTAQKK